MKSTLKSIKLIHKDLISPSTSNFWTAHNNPLSPGDTRDFQKRIESPSYLAELWRKSSLPKKNHSKERHAVFDTSTAVKTVKRDTADRAHVCARAPIALCDQHARDKGGEVHKGLTGWIDWSRLCCVFYIVREPLDGKAIQCTKSNMRRLIWCSGSWLSFVWKIVFSDVLDFIGRSRWFVMFLLYKKLLLKK